MFKSILFTFFLILVLNPLAAAFELSPRFEFFAAGTHQDIRFESPVNPGNRVLSAPEWIAYSELRPDLRLDLSNEQRFVLRSRHWLEVTQAALKSPSERRDLTVGRNDLSDLFWSQGWSESFETSVGLQNYQWGPAEINSPSNPYFHLDRDARSFTYRQKGRVLLRGNWSLSEAWALTALYEVIDHRDTEWMADEELVGEGFRPRPAVVIAHEFASRVESLALLVSTTPAGDPFLGGYGLWSPTEGFSVYFDGHLRGDRPGHRPVLVPAAGPPTFRPDNEDTEKWSTLSVFGFRAEGRVDFRFELIYNSAGYSSTEWKNGLQFALLDATNLKRFLRPGLEFRRRWYSYLSLRVPNLGRDQQSSFAFRALSELEDQTSALQFTYDDALSDAWVFYFESVLSIGPNNSEFRLLSNSQTSLGLRASF